jgi:hypothetical protein
MFFVSSFAAKGLIYLEVIRSFAIRHFDIDKHPLLVTNYCLIAILLVGFWIPVGAYAAIFK